MNAIKFKVIIDKIINNTKEVDAHVMIAFCLYIEEIKMENANMNQIRIEYMRGIYTELNKTLPADLSVTPLLELDFNNDIVMRRIEKASKKVCKKILTPVIIKGVKDFYPQFEEYLINERIAQIIEECDKFEKDYAAHEFSKLIIELRNKVVSQSLYKTIKL
jgi:hypothetical protein